MKLSKAVLIIDLQNDFCPGGRLAVSSGDKIIPVLNKYIRLFLKTKLPIFASRDWHPKETNHFKHFGGTWPAHCIAHTKGAMFHPGLRLPKQAIILSKGMGRDDGYSVFGAEDSRGSNFLNLLKDFRIDEIFVGGLATDYCVKYSVLDGLRLGFKIKLLIDALRGVDVEKGDCKRAIDQMISNGAEKVTFEKVDKLL